MTSPQASPEDQWAVVLPLKVTPRVHRCRHAARAREGLGGGCGEVIIREATGGDGLLLQARDTVPVGLGGGIWGEGQ